MKTTLFHSFLILILFACCKSKANLQVDLTKVAGKFNKNVHFDTAKVYAIIESKPFTLGKNEAIYYTLIDNFVPIDSLKPTSYLLVKEGFNIPILDDTYFQKWGRDFIHLEGHLVSVSEKGRVKYEGVKK